MRYSAMSVTIDGKPIDAIDIDYRSIEPEYGTSLFSLVRREPCSASIECTVPMSSVADFASLFRSEPVGASYATLARRVTYGGRKGRSAMRRLLKRALPINVRTEQAWFRGRAVMLNDTEMLIRAREQR